MTLFNQLSPRCNQAISSKWIFPTVLLRRWGWQCWWITITRGEGGEAERAQPTAAVAKSCQPFWKRWLAQGRVCRWKNQRAIREPSALSPESRVLRIYLVCLLAADGYSPGCTLSSAAGALRGPREGRPLCPFLPLGTTVRCKPQRIQRKADSDCLRVSALPPRGKSLVIRRPVRFDRRGHWWCRRLGLSLL